MSAPRTTVASLPSFCQKLSKFVEIWQSSDKNNFAQFFETWCRVHTAANADHIRRIMIFVVLIDDSSIVPVECLGLWKAGQGLSAEGARVEAP